MLADQNTHASENQGVSRFLLRLKAYQLLVYFLRRPASTLERAPRKKEVYPRASSIWINASSRNLARIRQQGSVHYHLVRLLVRYNTGCVDVTREWM